MALRSGWTDRNLDQRCDGNSEVDARNSIETIGEPVVESLPFLDVPKLALGTHLYSMKAVTSMDDTREAASRGTGAHLT